MHPELQLLFCSLPADLPQGPDPHGIKCTCFILGPVTNPGCCGHCTLRNQQLGSKLNTKTCIDIYWKSTGRETNKQRKKLKGGKQTLSVKLNRKYHCNNSTH